MSKDSTLNPSSLGLQVNVNDQIMGGAQLESGCPGTAHGHCNRDKASTAVALEVPVGLQLVVRRMRMGKEMCGYGERGE